MQEHFQKTESVPKDFVTVEGVTSKIWEQIGNKTHGLKADFRVRTPTKAIESLGFWRKRVRVELATRLAESRIAGFEGREGHRTPFASAMILQILSAHTKPLEPPKSALVLLWCYSQFEKPPREGLKC